MAIYMKSCSTIFRPNFIKIQTVILLFISWMFSCVLLYLYEMDEYLAWMDFYLGTASTCTVWWKKFLATTITLLLHFGRWVYPLGLARIFLYLVRVQWLILLEALLDLFSSLNQLQLSIFQIVCLSSFTSCKVLLQRWWLLALFYNLYLGMYTAVLSQAVNYHGTVARLKKLDIEKFLFLAETMFKDLWSHLSW